MATTFALIGMMSSAALVSILNAFIVSSMSNMVWNRLKKNPQNSKEELREAKEMLENLYILEGAVFNVALIVLLAQLIQTVL